MKLRSTALVKGFRQSAPYVNAHSGKTVVIMLGGEAIADPNFANIVNDIALLNSLGLQIVVVYGARPQISHLLTSQGYTTPYHKGIRVTDARALELVKQAAGQLQLDITARFSMGLNNTPMAGAQINVISGNFIIAQPLGIDDGIDYYHTGRIRRIDIDGIQRQLNQHSIVLLGPVASSVTGECFNLTSEEVATQLAIRLKADKLIGFCSEQGVIDLDGEVASEMLPNEAETALQRLIEAQEDDCGTARFLRGAVSACRAGVPRSHLISYKEDGALIQELFSLDGIGTQIVMASAEKVRGAGIDDIGGILDLIYPLEQEGILVRRSREQLEQEIEQFTIIERDGLIIACAALYPFPDEKIAEMACVAVHPDFRDGDRGVILLNRLRQQAKEQRLKHVFVLTTRSVHWFLEQGFIESDVEQLPMAKKALYNFQRRSKILVLAV
ncbi:amino-acid N-acetyltransferase [Photobacterium profundum]|uniref:Amino-acid acetyltransferase n=1 Tax=Photobacterium profundum (strain SS9) TaxID=298386 RepID=ARGA_PHOPR|nr:amino-acid N-acetyltransferase [Photobacterium profundum]Q6LMZ6.1 RecName: Full=Amino-acid acetyltransferase; AltName: Full=N-acetylglutamate synthase; Short=AGS; Short=NAGS [Photobacterium profundum SS9]CAG21330.1 putative N-acetylglutamate synthase [Photobacterium profundum SS9]